MLIPRLIPIATGHRPPGQLDVHLRPRPRRLHAADTAPAAGSPCIARTRSPPPPEGPGCALGHRSDCERYPRIRSEPVGAACVQRHFDRFGIGLYCQVPSRRCGDQSHRRCDVRDFLFERCSSDRRGQGCLSRRSGYRRGNCCCCQGRLLSGGDRGRVDSRGQPKRRDDGFRVSAGGDGCRDGLRGRGRGGRNAGSQTSARIWMPAPSVRRCLPASEQRCRRRLPFSHARLRQPGRSSALPSGLTSRWSPQPRRHPWLRARPRCLSESRRRLPEQQRKPQPQATRWARTSESDGCSWARTMSSHGSWLSLRVIKAASARPAAG